MIASRIRFFTCEVEWISPPFASFCGLVSALVFASFTLQEHDFGRFESWLALLSLSAWPLNSRVEYDFLYGLGLIEMPCFKGFPGMSIPNRKKSFTYSQLFIVK